MKNITKMPVLDTRTKELIDKPAKAAAEANGNGKDYKTITLNMPHELLADIDAIVAKRNTKERLPRKMTRTDFILDALNAAAAAEEMKAKKVAKK